MSCDATSAVTDIGFANTSCGAMPCPEGPLQAGCLPADLSARELDTVAAMIGVACNVHRGESVYRSGDRFHSIYTVKCGSFKTVMTLTDGREQVTGFHIAGETLGLDGVFGGSYTCDAIALEDSTLRILSFQALESLCHEVQAMQRHVHKLMSGEIIRESGLMTMLGTMTAQERVAVFLVNLSKRLAARGYSAIEFHLRMTREEIGSYLGLKLETVSRMLSKFHKEGLIDIQGKLIRILDFDGLCRV